MIMMVIEIIATSTVTIMILIMLEKMVWRWFRISNSNICMIIEDDDDGCNDVDNDCDD